MRVSLIFLIAVVGCARRGKVTGWAQYRDTGTMALVAGWNG
jgi:hypothetical protein